MTGMRRLVLLSGVIALAMAACTSDGSTPSSTDVTTPPAPDVTTRPATSTTLGEVGQGWELLGVAALSGGLRPPFAYLSAESANAEFLEERFGMTLDDVSFADQILLFLPLPTGAGCDESVSLDDLVIDDASQMVYGVFTRVPRDPDCSGLLASLEFLVAVDRDLLPP